MTDRDRRIAEEIYYKLCQEKIMNWDRKEIVVEAMQEYHEAKLKEATEEDIKMWSAKKVNEINEDLGYGDYLIIGAKAFRDGEIKIKL